MEGQVPERSWPREGEVGAGRGGGANRAGGGGKLHHRELLAVDFAIEIEGKYVGHAREIVEDGHDAGGKVWGVQLILRRDLFEQELCVFFLGREHGIAHEFEERIDDVIARKFDVHHFFGVVNAFARHGFAVAIGVVEPIGEATNERTGEGAGQNLGLVLHKGPHASAFEGVDHARAEEFDLVARVGVFGIGVAQLFALGFVEKAEVEFDGVLGREQTKLVCVFDIHDFIADIVGGFDEIHQRMARIADAVVRLLETGDAQPVEDAEKGVALGREEAHFRLIACQSG